MEAVFIVVLVGVALFVLFKLNKAASDYTKKTNQQLLDLWPLHERNVSVARGSSEHTYIKALEKAAVLISELKRRGLLEVDYTLEVEAFDNVANKMFSRSFEDVKAAARNNDATAIFQLGMLFHSIKELDTSYALIGKSAELGEAEAQYALGWAYMEGGEIGQDVIEAAKWFLISSENGYEHAAKAAGVTKKALSEDDYRKSVDLAAIWFEGNKKRPGSDAGQSGEHAG